VTTVVIGAGMAGIAAAHRLRERGEECVLLEAARGAGGLAATDRVDGFLFDQTGHFFHFSRPEVRQFFLECGVPLEVHRRQAAVAVRGRIVPYPVQYNLWALGDATLAREAVEGAVEAAERARTAPAPRSFAEYLDNTWGEALVALFHRPYNFKLWRRSLESLPADCAGNLAPPPNLDLMRRGCAEPVAYDGYNGTFLYPESGCLGDVVEALVAPLARGLRLEAAVRSIGLEDRALVTDDGREVPFDRLVSTMPLPRLLQAAGAAAPEAGLFDATRIAHVRVALRGAMRTGLHWLYVAEEALDLHRIGFPANVNPRTCPPGCVSLSLEYTLPAQGRCRTAAELTAAALDYLTALGLVEVEDCLSVSEVVLSPAYVVWRSPGRSWFAERTAGLARQRVEVAGRFGRWDYFSMEDAFASGWAAVDAFGTPSEAHA